MPVLLTRIGTPVPGRQVEAMEYAQSRKEAVNKTYALHAEVYLRFGGPVGQVVMVETFENLDAIEKLKKDVISASMKHKLPVAPAGVFSEVEERVWITV